MRGDDKGQLIGAEPLYLYSYAFRSRLVRLASKTVNKHTLASPQGYSLACATLSTSTLAAKPSSSQSSTISSRASAVPGTK